MDVDASQQTRFRTNWEIDEILKEKDVIKPEMVGTRFNNGKRKNTKGYDARRNNSDKEGRETKEGMNSRRGTEFKANQDKKIKVTGTKRYSSME